MAKKTSKRAQVSVQNKNAHIATRTTVGGRRRTETIRRDPNTLRVGVSTDERNNSTFMTISRGDEFITLSGREALTVFRTLEQHRDERDFSGFSW